MHKTTAYLISAFPAVSQKIGPEVALFIHVPKAAPIVLGSTWLVGAAIYPVLEFAKAFKSIDRLDIAVVLDEQDMGGPAALADFERITRAGPMALFVTDGNGTGQGQTMRRALSPTAAGRRPKQTPIRRSTSWPSPI